MKSLILLMFTGILGIQSLAQVPAIFWQKSFGGSSMDQAASVRQTMDGGYIIAGSSMSTDGDFNGNHGGFDYWIVKTDSMGGIAWQRWFGGSRDDYATSIQQTTDGGYIVCGYSGSADGDVTGNHNGSVDYWILKLNALGNIQWQHALGGSMDDYAMSVAQTTDGGYIVAGFSASTDGDVLVNYGGNDYWIVKLNDAGSTQWQQVLGGSGMDNATAVIQTTDGGYAIAGYSNSEDGNVVGNHNKSNDYWIVKLDASGSLSWSQSYGGSADDRANALIQANDGGYVVAGYTDSHDGDAVSGHGSNYDYWVLKLDGTGSLQWAKAYGGGGDDYATAVFPLDAGWVVAGYSASQDGDITGGHGGFDYWALQINPAGSIQWQRAMGGSGDDRATAVMETADHGFVLAGYTSSFDGDVTMNYGPAGTYDYWIVKLMRPTQASVAAVKQTGYTLYPNPSSGTVNITVPVQGDYNFTLRDMTGRSVLSRYFQKSGSIDAGMLGSGIYLYEITNDHGVTGMGKLVLY